MPSSGHPPDTCPLTFPGPRGDGFRPGVDFIDRAHREEVPVGPMSRAPPG